MSRLQSLAKETIVYGLSYSLGRIINYLLVTVYLTYKVFVTKDGSVAMYQDLYFYIALFLGFLTLRMETTLFRFVSKEKNTYDLYSTLSQLVFGACIIFLLLYYIFQPTIFQFLKYPKEFNSSINLACLILILDVLSSLPFAKIRYDKRPIRYAWIKLSGILINIALVLFFFEFQISQQELLLMSSADKMHYVLLANVASSAWTLIMLQKEFRLSFGAVQWNRVKDIINYSWPLILVTLIYTIIQNGYTSFLKYLLPGSHLENFSASDDLVAVVRLAVVMNIFITAFNYAAEPFFFRHSGDHDAPTVYARLNHFFVVACCAIYILICVNAPLASLLIGSAYRESLDLLPIFLLANIFSGIFTNMSSWYKLSDKTKQAAFISLIGLLLNVVLFIILVPWFGKNSTAWISLIVYFSMTIMSYVQGQRNYYIPYTIVKTITYLTLTVATVWLLQHFIGSLLLNYTYSILFSVMLVGIMLWITYQLEKNLIQKSLNL